MDAVAAALAAVPRAGFLPPGARHRADFDGPIGIGYGQTNSQPRTVEAMLRLLDVRHGQRVLDVGAGSGWTTALLAELTGPTGRVVGVVLEPELARRGAGNVEAVDNAEIRAADPDALGAPQDGPYDRILVSADAREIPAELLAQLTDDGRMVLPVNGIMTLVVRSGDHVALTRHGAYRFVPLR
jgi:protein-L-isoaspartate(D-aspartate) O-methyltransferase